MPHKVGKKWKWGNIERKSKEDLRRTVYGIWMKNGSKGSFSKFWKTGKVNESADGDMIEQLFDEAVSDYNVALGVDLSYMTFKVSTQPVYINGEPCYEYKPEECAGDWTKFGWIRLNPDIQSVKDYYGIGDMSDVDFMRAIIRHELAHEIWNVQGSNKLKEKILSMAEADDFSTVYLKTVKKSKLAEETFCEYLAANLDKLPSTCKEKMVFKKVQRDDLSHLLDEIEEYNENERFKRVQFEKYLGSDKAIDSEERSMYYGLFSLDGHCLALSYLNKTPGDCVLVAQVSCVVHGYGRCLLEDIIKRSKAMWLAADPTASSSLLEYYRSFGLEEVILDHSKWADGEEEHFFLKAHGESREQILSTIESARS